MLSDWMEGVLPAPGRSNQLIELSALPLPPVFGLRLEQSTRADEAPQEVAMLVRNRGNASLKLISDTPLEIDWLDSVNTLMAQAQGDRLQFDPALLPAGEYLITVSARRAGALPQSRVSLPMWILNECPQTTAADGCGISDTVGDGVADAFRAANPAVKPATGFKARPGRLAIMSGQYRGLVEINSLAENPPAGIISRTQALEPGFRNLYGLFDFELSGARSAGQTYEAVLELPYPLPAGARYRKFINGSWADFALTQGDMLYSATRTGGLCPLSHLDEIWQPGLNPGDECLKLIILDGGDNDASGEANGRVLDPGAVVLPTEIPPAPAPPGQQHSSSDCFIATAAFGTEQAPLVQLLREFRDQRLLLFKPGKLLVQAYYQTSPPIADWLAEREHIKPLVRLLLLPIAAFAWLLLNPVYLLAFFIIVLMIMRMPMRIRGGNL